MRQRLTKKSNRVTKRPYRSDLRALLRALLRGPPRPSAVTLVLLSAALLLSGCDSYVLQGRVVQGDVSDMAFVNTDDPRLAHPGVSGVRITVERDPDRLSATQVGSGLSDDEGRFAIALDSFGAGYLVEVFGVHASRAGYRNARVNLRLDADDERQLLVILAPGRSDPDETESLLEQYERFR